MVFWGVEVKPGQPQQYCPQTKQGKLHVTQATLGSGSGNKNSVIQCSVGGKTPVYLCSLLPNKSESCALNLNFGDEDESVEFSVTGDRSIHITGYIEPYDEVYENDDDEEDSDSDGINFGEDESGESSDFDSEEEEQMDELEKYLDNNIDMYRRANSARKSGVVIEEIEDEEKPVKESKTKRPDKKSQAKEDAKKQIVAKETANVSVEESEDEDGLPISKEASQPEKKEQVSNKKRKADAAVQDVVPESASKNKKNKNKKEKKKVENVSIEESPGSVKKTITESPKTPITSAEKKAEKKKASEEAKSSQMRTYPNGLVVEEVTMGKPTAKKASQGDKVSVRYIGKLKKNGKIFDSNIGKAPFQFRLGVGEVIKGWDVGVAGMRVGDKRRLTIPPAMGYGAKGAGGAIPPNAWLMFDVELIDVKQRS